jgi:hypothetical protein
MAPRVVVPAAAPSVPTASKPVSAATPASPEVSRPAYEDRIAPVGTAYEPVKLAKPGKLANRWNPGAAQNDDDSETAAPVPSMKDRMAAFSGGAGAPTPTRSAPQPSGKKLTWSERQAEAKRQREEEEGASAAAISACKALLLLSRNILFC